MHQEAAFQEAAFIMARRVALEKLEEKKHLGGRLKRRDIRNEKAAIIMARRVAVWARKVRGIRGAWTQRRVQSLSRHVSQHPSSSLHHPTIEYT